MKHYLAYSLYSTTRYYNHDTFEQSKDLNMEDFASFEEYLGTLTYQHTCPFIPE